MMQYQNMYGIWLLLVIYLSLLLLTVSSNDFDLKKAYFKALVTEESTKAKDYSTRTSNGDFLDFIESNVTYDYGNFDFIVVGAGSAGSVIASRLSEIKNWNVLVLEAGDEYDDFCSMPFLFPVALNSDRNWGYNTAPQKNGCFGYKDNRCPYGRGKIVGGSGSINAAMYIRGIKADYDRWANQGNPGWSYEDVLPYFKKAENMDFDGEEAYHGFAGNINTAQTPIDNQLNDAIAEASREMGFKEVDYNGGHQIGFGKVQGTIRYGRRESGANRYIEDARVRRNFNLTTKAYVIEILIHNRAAYGVKFVMNKRLYTATANSEVIISGGSINSPQLLLLSGIGPKEDLTKLGITPVLDLPIGQYFQDHLGVLYYIIRTNYSKAVMTQDELVTDFLHGRGQYTQGFATTYVTFANLQDSSSNVPNVELIWIPPTGIPRTPLRNQSSDIEANVIDVIDSSTDITMIPIVLHPKSKGKLTLTSNDARDFPELDINIFSDEEDMETFENVTRFLKEMIATPSFQKYNATLIIPDLDGCKQHELDTKEHWRCLYRHLAIAFYHGISTVKMGPPEDPLACVDRNLKVYGVNNLRVVDVGVMPVTNSGHTNAPAFMIGEKAADLIKKEYRVQD